MTISHRNHLAHQPLTSTARKPSDKQTDEILATELPLDQILLGTVSVACFAAVGFYVSWPIGLALAGAMVIKSISKRMKGHSSAVQAVWTGIL
jgi:hypothetical protein